ncbi:MAG: hypothetical protein AAF497_15705 [Planctomycetota bacterium]
MFIFTNKTNSEHTVEAAGITGRDVCLTGAIGSHVLLAALATILVALPGCSAPMDSPDRMREAQEQETPTLEPAGDVRFAAFDLIAEVASPLAAYQVELISNSDDCQIVGVEGGDHAAFAEPPFYDSAALNNSRIAIAAYSTDSDLPNGQVRLARIHIQCLSGHEPEFEIRPIVVAAPDGASLPAEFKLRIAQGD